ncbi:MAG: PilN domain-containing protein [Pyrinomonadaceae bacterium]|nr:PilN domain-containing protein [Pyrinomonadaceae bacterium]
MIKINLLNSVGDRPRGMSAVETKVTDPRTQTRLLMLAVGAVAILIMGFDWASARSANHAAQEELEKQQRIAAQMAAVSREQSELEKRTKDIQLRIVAIQKLRSSQQGPVAVLSAINERLPALGNFRLEGIEQKAGELVIRGDSQNEMAVTNFGRSLEFSSGLFSNVNIEIQRKTLDGAVVSNQPPSAEGMTSGTPTLSETVNFTIKCRYTPPTATALAGTSASATTNTGVNTVSAPSAGQVAVQ